MTVNLTEEMRQPFPSSVLKVAYSHVETILTSPTGVKTYWKIERYLLADHGW